MKIISFDIGIKNLAYIIMNIDEKIDIIEWKTENLLELNQTNHYCYLCHELQLSHKLSCTQLNR